MTMNIVDTLEICGCLWPQRVTPYLVSLPNKFFKGTSMVMDNFLDLIQEMNSDLL